MPEWKVAYVLGQITYCVQHSRLSEARALARTLPAPIGAKLQGIFSLKHRKNASAAARRIAALLAYFNSGEWRS